MRTLRFTSKTCVPCKVMAPVVDEMRKLGYDIIDKKLEDEDSMKLAAELGVMQVPTFIVLDDDGQEVRRQSGAMKYSDFKTFLDG